METYHYFLTKIRRELNFPAQVHSFGYYEKATGVFSGVRGNLLEYGIRLMSEESEAVEKVNGTTYKTPFPHIVIKGPQIDYSSYCTSPREIFFIIYPAEAIPFLRSIGIQTEFGHQPMPAREVIVEYIERFRQLCKDINRRGTADRIDQLAFQCICEFYLTEPSTRTSIQYDAKITAIANYFREKCTQKINLNQLIQRNGLSRRTFFRFWKLKFNQSPKKYIEEYRFQKALHLLTETVTPLNEIAEQLSFPSLSYFCEHFRKHFHQTPLQMRNRHKCSVCSTGVSSKAKTK